MTFLGMPIVGARCVWLFSCSWYESFEGKSWTCIVQVFVRGQVCVGFKTKEFEIKI